MGPGALRALVLPFRATAEAALPTTRPASRALRPAIGARPLAGSTIRGWPAGAARAMRMGWFHTNRV